MSNRRITVLRLGRRQTLFEFLGDRIQMVGPGEPGAEAPDIVLFPVIKGELDYTGPEFQLAPELAARIATGKAILVIDFSAEGVPHTPARGEHLHRYLQGLGVPPARCVYITQDRSYEAAYRAQCREREWAPVRILTYDYFIRLTVNQTPREAYRQFKARRAAFRQRPASRERRFISLNFTARAAKVLLLLTLMDKGLWDEGFISFGGFGRRGSRASGVQRMRKALGEMRGFEDLVERVAPHLETLDAHGPILLGSVPRSMADPSIVKTPILDYRVEHYDRSWFTLVTETEIEGPRRITEKSIKPLLNFHPAIVLGNPGALELIRSFGFRTFPGYFDESYDAEADPRRRFEMVLGEVERLCRLDEDDLRRLDEAAAETVTHNAYWGLTQLPAIYRERIDVAVFKDIAWTLKGGPADRPAPDLRVVQA